MLLWRGFQKPKRLAVDAETLTDTFGKFSAQPFERGFGTTIGNALRRTLLSSIEGAAVTAIRIEGVLHEFQSITGVVEDATDIILNLKQIPFKLNGDGPKALYLRADAAGVVLSGSIEADSDVEILDPSYRLCSLSSKDAKLTMEIGVEKGRGYVMADRQRNVEHMIGLIPLDSIFSPIRKVNFTVDDTRVGQSVDFDRLTIEVETNGSITPDESLSQAAAIMQEQLDLFVSFNNRAEPLPEAPPNEWDIPVETLNLSVRSFNCLKRAGISKVSELLDLTEDEIMKMRNFGKKSLDEIKQVLAERGLTLRQA